MPLPFGNRDIVFIRQGGKEPQYDENSRRIFNCIWEEVLHVYCVDHAPVTRGAESDATTTHDLETAREAEMFYFSLSEKNSFCGLDIKRGDYIIQKIVTGCNYAECPEEGGYLLWKVVGKKKYNIMNGCWDFKITGERLMGREQDQMLVECSPLIKQLEGIVTNG